MIRFMDIFPVLTYIHHNGMAHLKTSDFSNYTGHIHYILNRPHTLHFKPVTNGVCSLSYNTPASLTYTTYLYTIFLEIRKISEH